MHASSPSSIRPPHLGGSVLDIFTMHQVVGRETCIVKSSMGNNEVLTQAMVVSKIHSRKQHWQRLKHMPVVGEAQKM